MAVLLEPFGIQTRLSTYFYAAFLFLACYLSCSSILRQFYKKPLSVPVLNLHDRGFSHAQRFYLANLKVLLQDGYAKVSITVT